MDINEQRQIAASKCVDIVVLVYAALCHTYDLQTHLENIGTYRHEKKQAINRALTTLNNIFSGIGYSFHRNTTYKHNGPKLCDEFINLVDTHIGMEGEEREMNIISFCCERAYKYSREVICERALFSVIPHIAKDIKKVPVMLNPISYEKHDLSIIFNQQLRKLYTERKYD